MATPWRSHLPPIGRSLPAPDSVSKSHIPTNEAIHEIRLAIERSRGPVTINAIMTSVGTPELMTRISGQNFRAVQLSPSQLVDFALAQHRGLVACVDALSEKNWEALAAVFGMEALRPYFSNLPATMKTRHAASKMSL